MELARGERQIRSIGKKTGKVFTATKSQRVLASKASKTYSRMYCQEDLDLLRTVNSKRSKGF